MSGDKKEGQSDLQIDDLEEIASNLAQLLEQGGNLAAKAAENVAPDAKEIPFNEVSAIANSLAELAKDVLSDPQRAIDAQNALWQGHMQLWASQVQRLMGAHADPVAQPEKGDRRFADPEWSDNQFFDFIKQAYLVTADWADKVAEQADGLNEHEKQKAQFYVRQVANALSPSNFLLTNPELLRETVDSKGANLVRGMQMLGEDIERGKGMLKVRQADPNDFKVGENLALSPGKVVFQNDLFQLVQYTPSTQSVLKAPLLIVPPWINKFYVLDLTPEKSFIKWCVDQGQTVFVMSWANPDERHAQKTWEDYIREGIVTALDAIEQATGETSVNTIGYCVGGTLLSTTLCVMANDDDSRIQSATFLTTQIDFTHAGDLLVFVDEEQIQGVEAQIAERGYLDASKMAAAFNMLRSNDLIWPYVVNNYMKGKSPMPFDLLFWNSDATRMPGKNHSFYLRQFYLNNNLTKGKIALGGKTLDLSKVTIPIYNLATKEDHIAPAKSAFLGTQFLSGPVRFVLSGSGHIAGVVNPPVKNKYQFWTGGPAKGGFEDWFAKAEEHPGSWWPDWHAWIEAQDTGKVDARTPGSGKLTPIEDAPGSYVREKS